MKFDSWRMELSWDCKENTTYLKCVMIHKEKGPIEITVRWNLLWTIAVLYKALITLETRQQ